jgi:fumarate hydratase subunit beta
MNHAQTFIKLETPLTETALSGLRAGDEVRVYGAIYTARDAAHARLVRLLAAGEPLPFSLKGSIIFYCGPTPAKPDRPVGSCGPTTSYRMDSYAPDLIRNGLKGMIGKGTRGEAVVKAMEKYRAVYLGAVGGAAALLAQKVVGSKIVAYKDLGPEAIFQFEVADFPAIVVNDIYGGDLYRDAPGRRD